MTSKTRRSRKQSMTVDRLLKVLKNAKGVHWFMEGDSLRVRLEYRERHNDRSSVITCNFCPITMAAFLETNYRFGLDKYCEAGRLLGLNLVLARKIAHSVDNIQDSSSFSQSIRNKFLRMAGLL